VADAELVHELLDERRTSSRMSRCRLAVVQLRNATEGRAYYDAKKAAGKTSMEAMRALKRRLSNVVYRRMPTTRTDERRRALQAHPPYERALTFRISRVLPSSPRS
jgi:hypothetical protein